MGKNYEKVQLSSKWTDIGFYATIAMFVLIAPIIIMMLVTNSNPESNPIVAILILLALTAFVGFVLLTLCKGRIENNQIYLKKYFKPEIKYNLEDVHDVKVYETRKDVYILLTMKQQANKVNYLLVSSKLFYAGEKLNTVSVLEEILANNINKK